MKKLTPILLFVAVVLFFPACKSILTSPSSVAEDFLTAIKYGDFQKARELASPGSYQAIATLETFASFSKFRDSEFKITRDEVDGEYAVVYYLLNDNTEENSLNLKKDSEKGWVVIFTKSDFPAAQSNNWDININSDDNRELRRSAEELGEAVEKLANTFAKEFEVEIEEFANEIERAAEDIGKAAEKFGKDIDKKAPYIEDKLKELEKKYDRIEYEYDNDELTEEQYEHLKDILDEVKKDVNDLNRTIKKKGKKGLFD